MTASVAVDFNQCVDRRLVHRSSNASVFLTSIREQYPGVWRVGVQVPRWASGSGAEHHRVPLIHGVEVLRQCGIAVTHTGYGVPLGYGFTIQNIDFTWRGSAGKFPMFGPFEASANVEVADRYERRGITTGLRLRFSMYSSEGVMSAEGGGLLRCLTPDQYRILRREAPAPKDVELRYDPAPLRNVRQRARTLEAKLGWNHSDPFAFDHPTDHLPGVSMIDSAACAAENLTANPVLGISAEFYRFTEFAPGATVRAQLQSANTVGVEVLQSGGVTAAGICHVAA